MYIQINGKEFSCTDYQNGHGLASFSGVEGLTLPVSGEIKLISEDGDGGLELTKVDCGNYARQVYEGGVLTLTNEPEPPAPTAEELLEAARAAALARISGKCSAAIESGVTVGGKSYRLNEYDQTAINAALALVAAGETQIPFAAEDGATSLYTPAAVKAVAKAAYGWVLANRKYNAALYAWIEAETDGEVLAVIDYGSALPAVYMQALASELTAAGIDAGTMAAMLK